jgi:hypothetical protein
MTLQVYSEPPLPQEL